MRRVLIVSGLLMFVICAVNYWPVVLGYVPLPAEIVLRFPPFEGNRSAEFQSSTHAEMSDLITQIYPWREFAAESMKQGVVPLWNPHLLAGTPFLANSQSAVFYPLNLIYYFLPATTAWSLSLILKIVLAGVFTAMLAESVGASLPGAIASAVVFGLSGFITAWQGFPMADAAIWLPLALFGIDRLWKSPSKKCFVVTSVALAMPVLAGHPETAAHVAAIATAFAGYRAVGAAHKHRRLLERAQFIVLFSAAGFLAMFVAAVQMFPTLEWLGHARLSLESEWPARPFRELLTLLSRDTSATPNAANIFIPEGAGYVGPVALLLMFVSFFHSRKRDVLFFWVLILVCLQIAFGFGPAHWLVVATPVLKGLKNSRLLFGADLGIAIVAGFGLSVLGSHRFTVQHRFRAWLAVSSGVAVVTLGIVLLRASTVRVAPWWQTPRATFVLLMAAALILAAALLGRMKPSKVSARILSLIVIDFVTFSYAYMPFVSPETIFPASSAFDFLKQQQPPFRVAGVNFTTGSNFEMPYGVSTVGGYDIQLRRLLEFVDGLRETGVDGVTIQAERVMESEDRRLDLLNTKYLIASTTNQSATLLETRPDRFRLVFSDGSTRIFENLSVMPKAYIVGDTGIEVLPDELDQLARVKAPTFDPASTVVLERSPFVPEFFDINSTESNSEIDSFVQETNEIRLTAKAATRGILVLSEMNYPGWKVKVDGMERPLLRPNYTLMGVAIEPGQHDVQFIFEPASFKLGFACSLAGLIVVVIVLVDPRVQLVIKWQPCNRISPARTQRATS